MVAARSGSLAQSMVQFWFATGLRPGELQAVLWEHVDFKGRTVRIELNHVAKIIKAPKTKAGIRNADLTPEAIEALLAQRPMSAAKGASASGSTPARRSPGPRTPRSARRCGSRDADARPWSTATPTKFRHTFASALLMEGANPCYVANQLDHETVEMVFRHYSRFIREGYQKPKTPLRLVS